jgi:electron transfer flavoprotein alpha subunit
MSHTGVWIVAETGDNDLKPTTLELLAAGRSLADTLGQPLVAILLGHEVTPLASKLFAYGADKVVVAEHAALQQVRSEPYLETIAAILQQNPAEILLLGHTALGKDIAGRLAVRLGGGLTTDCTQLSLDGGELQKVHPVFGGSLMTCTASSARPQMATVRPKAFARLAEQPGRAGEVVNFPVTDAMVQSRTAVLDVVREAAKKIALTDAEIIVSGGRGMGGPENWHLIENLANALGAAHGASRAVVDAGWRPHSEQVGQTGKTVSPKVYVACGISGAIQHLVGMRSSKYIIAINTDPEAPIMKVANVAIVGDVMQVIPQLIEEVKKVKAGAPV